jgi:hypothetical protein
MEMFNEISRHVLIFTKHENEMLKSEMGNVF